VTAQGLITRAVGQEKKQRERLELGLLIRLVVGVQPRRIRGEETWRRGKEKKENPRLASLAKKDITFGKVFEPGTPGSTATQSGCVTTQPKKRFQKESRFSRNAQEEEKVRMEERIMLLIRRTVCLQRRAREHRYFRIRREEKYNIGGFAEKKDDGKLGRGIYVRVSETRSVGDLLRARAKRGNQAEALWCGTWIVGGHQGIDAAAEEQPSLWGELGKGKRTAKKKRWTPDRGIEKPRIPLGDEASADCREKCSGKKSVRESMR